MGTKQSVCSISDEGEPSFSSKAHFRFSVSQSQSQKTVLQGISLLMGVPETYSVLIHFDAVYHLVLENWTL